MIISVVCCDCSVLTMFVPCGTLCAMYDAANIPKNLAFLLWKKGLARDQWVGELATWCNCDRLRAAQILRGNASPVDSEMENLAQSTEVDSAQLFFADLLDGADVFGENLKFLLNSLEHGGQKRLAEYLEVTPGTVYKWNGGSQPPKRNHVLGILSFFGLNHSIDLYRTPLFLSLDPVGSKERKDWLIERINQIEDCQLDEYFPALRKILQ